MELACVEVVVLLLMAIQNLLVLTVQNSIVALNEASSGKDIYGSVTAGSSYNLIGPDPEFVSDPSPGGDGTWGTPDDVRARVKECIEKYGRSGGLILAPTHVLEPEVPLANIDAFAEACREYGAC